MFSSRHVASAWECTGVSTTHMCTHVHIPLTLTLPTYLVAPFLSAGLLDKLNSSGNIYFPIALKDDFPEYLLYSELG